MNDLKAKTRLTMREAAEYLGHSYSWIHTNHRVIGLGGYRIGGRWFFDKQDLDAWVNKAKANSGARGYLPLRDNKRGWVNL
jgi:excisionase family DNA binding protein